MPVRLLSIVVACVLAAACTSGEPTPTESGSGAPTATPSGRPSSDATSTPADDGGLAWEVISDEQLRPAETGGTLADVVVDGDGWLFVGATTDDTGRSRPATWSGGEDGTFRRDDLPAGDAGALASAVVVRDDGVTVVVGSAGGEGRTPAAVWRREADGAFEAVDDDALAPSEGLTLGDVTVTPDGAFVALGATQDDTAVQRPRLYRSDDGRAWEAVPGLAEHVADATQPWVSEVVAFGDGLAVLGGDSDEERSSAMVHTTSDLETWSTTDVPADGDVSVTDAEVHDGTLHLVGAVRDGTRFAPYTWRTDDLTQWDHQPATIAYDEQAHTSSNPTGSGLHAFTRAGDRWVGSVYVAAANLPVTSTDGVTWTEIPMPEVADDQLLPSLTTLAATDDRAIMASDAPSRPTVLALADDTLTELDAPELPSPAESLNVRDAQVVDDTLWVVGSRTRHQSLREPEDRGGVVWSVDGDTVDRKAPGAFVDTVVADVVADGGAPLLVGYDAFIQEILRSRNVWPTMWSRVSDRWVRLPHDAVADDPSQTTRAYAGAAFGDVLVMGGHVYRDGDPEPAFWVGEGETWQPAPIAGADGMTQASVSGICPTADGLLAWGYHDDGGRTSVPVLWWSDDGTAWDAVVTSRDAFGEALPDIDACASRDDGVVLVGDVDDPSRPAAWHTADGRELEPIELPDLGEESAVSDVEVDPDGGTWMLATRRVDGERVGVLLHRTPEGELEEHDLGGSSFRSDRGPASALTLAHAGTQLVVVGWLDGAYHVWRADRPSGDASDAPESDG